MTVIWHAANCTTFEVIEAEGRRSFRRVLQIAKIWWKRGDKVRIGRGKFFKEGEGV